MKRRLALFFGTMIAFLCLHITSPAQDKKGEIVINLTKEIDRVKKMFKKTYNSIEELKADKELKAFSADDDITWMSLGEASEKELVVKVDSKEGGTFTITTSDDENMHVTNLSDLTEEQANVEVNIQRIVKSIDKESVNQIQKIVKTIDHEEDVILIETEASTVNISIAEVKKSDFGKNALTTKGERLEDENLKLKILGDQLLIKLPVEEETDVKIILKDKVGEDLYLSRVKEAKNDITQVIDLSQSKAGDYLLEVKKGDQRLTRKISITEKE